jgi:plastocyanin
MSEPHAKSRTLTPRAAAATALALGLIALAGCGSSSSSSATTASTPATTASTPAATSSTATAPTSSAGTTLALEANKEGQLEYNTKSLSAKAGKVNIDFTNMAPIGHNVTVESSSGTVIGATPTFQGATKTLSLDLKPGTYKYFCSVPGHRMAGMEGTITVK